MQNRHRVQSQGAEARYETKSAIHLAKYVQIADQAHSSNLHTKPNITKLKQETRQDEKTSQPAWLTRICWNSKRGTHTVESCVCSHTRPQRQVFTHEAGKKCVGGSGPQPLPTGEVILPHRTLPDTRHEHGTAIRAGVLTRSQLSVAFSASSARLQQRSDLLSSLAAAFEQKLLLPC